MGKRNITFIIWSMFDGAGSGNYAIASGEVATDQSIRPTAIKIIKSLDGSNVDTRASFINDDSSIIIKPLPSGADLKHFIDKDPNGFGPKYAINPDGSLQILKGSQSMRPWTIDEFDQLSDSGYIDYEKDHVVIVIPEGLGASVDFAHLSAMLATVTNIIGIGKVALSLPRVIRRIFGWLNDKDARKIAEQWASQGIKYPEDLRKWIDLKAEWRLSEVKARLKINEENAIKLLISLGLELVNDSWRLTQSKESILKRKRWMDNERKWQKKRGGGG